MSPLGAGATSSSPAVSATPRVGQLFLVPAPLDFGCQQQVSLPDVMPSRTLEQAAQLRYWICENAKSTRAYLKRLGALVPLVCAVQDLVIQELPRAVHKKGDHRGEFDARPLLKPALQGHDMGLVSEAGMPAVADPGSSVVRAAHDLALPVQALVGPASLLLALASSGLNGQNFAFVGYLPQASTARARRAQDLEKLAQRTGQTQMFIEVPYRNSAMLQTLLQVLGPATRLAISSALTLEQASSRSASVAAWRSAAWALDNTNPAVFALGP